MKVIDLMHRDVRTLNPDATVADAIVALSDAHVTGLPIVDQLGQLLGVLSTSDVLEAEAEAGDSEARTTVLEETRVSDLMTLRPITVSPDTTVQEAARQMLYADVKRLFVAHDGRLVGVLSQTDIVGAVAKGQL
jgi:CBS domain-containing protein